MKIGDRVRMLKKDAYNFSGADPYENEIGIVTNVDGDCFTCRSGDNKKYFGFFREDELEPVEEIADGSFLREYNFIPYPSPRLIVDYDFDDCGIQVLKEQYNKQLKEKIMDTTKSVVEFAKNMMLTKEEKLLRKAGLQDERGNWTSQAFEIVQNLLAQELGFKTYKEAEEKYYDCVTSLSFMELHQAFTKYDDKLIEIAEEFEKENKNK